MGVGHGRVAKLVFGAGIRSFLDVGILGGTHLGGRAKAGMESFDAAGSFWADDKDSDGEEDAAGEA